MKVYRMEILVYGFDGVTAAAAREEITNMRHANARVMSIQEADIGEWDDAHPLNRRETLETEFRRLFPREVA